MDDSCRCRLSVVVLNYQTPDLVIQCVNSLLPQVEDARAQVVIVDNNSCDNSESEIRRWLHALPRAQQQLITFVISEINGGFASGNNLGIRQVEADYYLLVNSDTLLRPNAIQKLLDAADQDKSAGLIGPRLEFMDGQPQESCFRQFGIASEFMRGAQLSAVSYILRRWQVPIQIDDHDSEIEWMSFACVLIRREVIEEVGLLDQKYFMYFEDADYCRRARSKGWYLLHQPHAHVVHLRGGTSDVKSRAARRARLPRYYYESRSRYFRQKAGAVYLFCVNTAWLMGRIICLTKLLFGKRDRGAATREWQDLWTDFLGNTGGEKLENRRST